MQWECFYRPLADYKCTSQDWAFWNGQFMHSTHLSFFDFHFQIMHRSLHLFSFKQTDLFRNLYFWYILQSWEIMKFMHWTEMLLCYNGRLKGVGANEPMTFHFEAKEKQAQLCSLFLEMVAGEMSQRLLLNPLFNMWRPRPLHIPPMSYLAHPLFL